MPTSIPLVKFYKKSREGRGGSLVLATISLHCSAIKEESHGGLGQKWLIHHSATLCIRCCTNLRRNKDLLQQKEPMLSQKDELPS